MPDKQEKIRIINASKQAIDAKVKVDGRSTHKSLDRKAAELGISYKK